MKIYRFAIHPAEDGVYFLECVNDPKLFTQARSMDEAVHMARDVAATMYGETNVQIELVVPPDVNVRPQRRKARPRKSPQKRPRGAAVAP